MTGNAIHGGRVSICGQRARCQDPRQKAKKPQFIIIDIDRGEVALPLQSARHEEGELPKSLTGATLSPPSLTLLWPHLSLSQSKSCSRESPPGVLRWLPARDLCFCHCLRLIVNNPGKAPDELESSRHWKLVSVFV